MDVDQNWAITLLALNLEESLIKKKLLELRVDDRWLKGKDYFILVKKVSELIEEKENRRVSVDVLISQGYRSVRNKIDHEGYKWKPTKDESDMIVAHSIRLSRELWMNPIPK